MEEWGRRGRSCGRSVEFSGKSKRVDAKGKRSRKKRARGGRKEGAREAKWERTALLHLFDPTTVGGEAFAQALQIYL